MRNNLGLCKHSDIYCICNFQKRDGSHGIKIQMCKERYIKQINDIRELKKITAEFGEKGLCLKKIRDYDTEEKRGGIRYSCCVMLKTTLLLIND